jgi:hypothetical protein
VCGEEMVFVVYTFVFLGVSHLFCSLFLFHQYIPRNQFSYVNIRPTPTLSIAKNCLELGHGREFADMNFEGVVALACTES